MNVFWWLQIPISSFRKVMVFTLSSYSMRSKFDLLKELVSDTIEILILLETKLDWSFPTCQLHIEGYMPPIRADRNRKGGVLLILIKEGAPVKEIPLLSSTAKEIEGKTIEVSLLKIKWLLLGIYRPPSQLEGFFLGEVSSNIEHFCAR